MKTRMKGRLGQNEDGTTPLLYVASFGILAAIILVGALLDVLVQLVGGAMVFVGVFGWGFQILPPRGWPGVAIGLVMAVIGIAVIYIAT